MTTKIIIISCMSRRQVQIIWDFLINDDTGDKMAVITKRCRGDPEDITYEVLREWVRGRGVTVSWESLVETLRKCEISLLADQIEMVLQSKQH